MAINLDKYNIEIIESISKNTLRNNIESVNQFIGNGHDSTAWIRFEVNSFVLDTRSQDSRDHYALSLENQKTGAGVGNKFTLKIAYNPNYSQYSSATELEKAISLLPEALLYTDDVDMIRKVTNVKNICKLQYGYLKNSTLKTYEYSGILLKYSVRANKQILEYTLNGIAGEEAAIGTVNWYPHIVGLADSPTDDSKIAELITAAEAETTSSANRDELIRQLNQYFTNSLKMDPLNALYCFIQDYNNDAKKIDVNATTFKICVTSNAKAAASNLTPVSLSLCRNQTPISYIDYIVSMFSENVGQYSLVYYRNKLGITSRWVHEYKYDRDNNVVKIIIDRIISNEDNVYDYDFKGYTLDNNLLIDYNLDYDGTVALAVAGSTSTDSKNNIIYIDANGQLQAKASITKDMFVSGEIDEVLVKKQNTWVDKISCANKCTMTTFGLPFEIPIGAVFRVRLFINNKPHHTSGRCYVTGIVDRIENSSFTTTFSMIRLPGKGGVES